MSIEFVHMLGETVMQRHPDAANEQSQQIARAQSYLNDALDADSQAAKNDAIRRALQRLVIENYRSD